MRISGLFDKGKFASRLLSGDVCQLEGFVQICTDLAEQIYARRENRNPSTTSSLPRWNPPSATRGSISAQFQSEFIESQNRSS
jgi:hypothetical protein